MPAAFARAPMRSHSWSVITTARCRRFPSGPLTVPCSLPVDSDTIGSSWRQHFSLTYMHHRSRLPAHPTTCATRTVATPVNHRIHRFSSPISTKCSHACRSLSPLYKITALDSHPNLLQNRHSMGDRQRSTNSSIVSTGFSSGYTCNAAAEGGRVITVRRGPERNRAPCGALCENRPCGFGPVAGATCAVRVPSDCAVSAAASVCASSRVPALQCDRWWARLGLNQRPLPCEDSALPLSYAPGGRIV